MEELEQEMKVFMQAIKGTTIYKEFLEQKERMRLHPELESRIDEFRARNYELQTKEDDGSLFEEIDQFMEEYEQFRKNPLVYEFLEKEVAYCRMVQEVHSKLLDMAVEDFE